MLAGITKHPSKYVPYIKKEIKIYPEFLEPEYKNLISNYEDVSIEKSVSGQLELCGFKLSSREEADVILIVNNFKEKQGELVMGWKTQPFDRDFVPPNRPYCIADVRFANGGDNAFVEQLLNKLDLKNFYGYAGWNTSANTLGSLLCALKVKWNASQYDENAFKKFATTRLLDDWAYQANVRAQISEPTDIKQLMKPYENRLSDIFNYDLKNRNYSYPWQRRFEIEVSTAL